MGCSCDFMVVMSGLMDGMPDTARLDHAVRSDVHIASGYRSGQRLTSWSAAIPGERKSAFECVLQALMSCPEPMMTVVPSTTGIPVCTALIGLPDRYLTLFSAWQSADCWGRGHQLLHNACTNQSLMSWPQTS